MSRGSISHNYEYINGYSIALQNIHQARLILKIRQQPIQTRQSTNNERDRRPLDPPPIVQIEIENSTVQETQDFLQNPYLFMSVSLVHSNTLEDIDANQSTLSGQTSSSMYKLKDINNHDGGFFVFGDVSVKLEGQFRLKFSMFEITQYGVTNLKSIYSNVFQVYSSKTFPGMLESTFLSRSFSDQGVRIRIRKEHRVQIAGSSSRKRKLSVSQEEEERYQQPSPTRFMHAEEQRRSSIQSMISEGRRASQTFPHIDRRTSLPFSPPHQSYDPHRYYEKINSNYHPHRLMIPSPPPQSSLFNKVEDKLNMRRQSADPQYYSSSIVQNNRRLSLQQQCNEEIIHLPPLRLSSIKNENNGGIIEVDAAVAMMQLATRQQQH